LFSLITNFSTRMNCRGYEGVSPMMANVGDLRRGRRRKLKVLRFTWNFWTPIAVGGDEVVRWCWNPDVTRGRLLPPEADWMTKWNIKPLLYRTGQVKTDIFISSFYSIMCYILYWIWTWLNFFIGQDEDWESIISTRRIMDLRMGNNHRQGKGSIDTDLCPPQNYLKSLSKFPFLLGYINRCRV